MFSVLKKLSNTVCVNSKSSLTRKKDIFEEDIETLVSEDVSKMPETYRLVDLSISSGMRKKPKATITLKVDGKKVKKITKW